MPESSQPSAGELSVLAVRKGEALAKESNGAAVLTDVLDKMVGQIINSSLHVTATGLSVDDGVQPTEDDVTSLLSGLSTTYSETGKFRATLGWCIADAAIMCDQFEGGMDRVCAQAMKPIEQGGHGLKYANFMQMVRTARTWPNDGTRIPGLSLTAHSELTLYRQSCDPAKYAAIVDELREGAKSDSLPSCAELREALQAAGGKKPEKVNGDKPLGKNDFAMVALLEIARVSEAALKEDESLLDSMMKISKLCEDVMKLVRKDSTLSTDTQQNNTQP